MTRFLLPHDKKSMRCSGLLWCIVATVLPSIAVAVVWRPIGPDHIGLLLGSVLVGSFIYVTGSSLTSKVFTNKQVVYRRNESPIRYWIHTTIITAATILLLFFWIRQMGIVVGI